MDKEFLKIHKMFCVLFVVIGIVMLCGQVISWYYFIKLNKSENEEEQILNSNNNWVKESYYGTNGKRYSIDE